MNDKSNTWWTKIRKGLFFDQSGKHHKRMGSAVWLYGYLHVCADKNGVVTHKHKTISRNMGIPLRSIREMMKTLRLEGYVEVKRRPHHSEISILKWGDSTKKSNKKELQDSAYHEGERTAGLRNTELLDSAYHPQKLEFTSHFFSRRKVVCYARFCSSNKTPLYKTPLASPKNLTLLPRKESGFEYKKRVCRGY
ncbi:MAG: hypothetical protein COV66_01795 [Nitrospinae bacterium CG11_big_fil_rev_8_21_14_0_20_45_15]|nr:MAG: hypothetical protein COV66_01795 [Nitrospinae bacterium CG11_big_fil_rev_8_21_14_0_20_45_15]